MTTSLVNSIIEQIKIVAREAAVPEVVGATGGWLVKFGPLQQDPGQNGINITIYSNDPNKVLDWSHRRIETWPTKSTVGAVRTLPQGFNPIGGGQGFFRRFTVEGRIFLNQTDEDEEGRDEMAQLVLSSLEYHLNTTDRFRSTPTDSFKEKVIGGFYPVVESELIGGGESGIYDLTLRLEFATFRDY